jgi:hypothetical protein
MYKITEFQNMISEPLDDGIFEPVENVNKDAMPFVRT